jgi:hypothetical protein
LLFAGNHGAWIALEDGAGLMKETVGVRRVSLRGWMGVAVMGFGLMARGAMGQDASPVAARAEERRPMPDVVALMHEVEERQRAAEMKEKDYIYREAERVETLDGRGGVKKTETREYDVFWLNGVVVQKRVKEDGKELSAEEQKKESERIDKAATKARERKAKADAKGQVTDANGPEEITVSRMLELGSFTNARREMVNGRATILVDFAGDPKAKTRNPAESAIHEMGGTVWVDEQDRAIQHLEGRFLNNFKIGGGLLVNVKKDTSFTLTQVKVNDEVWLPSEGGIDGQARMLLLFSVNGRFRVRDSDYRKFKATSTILPGYVEAKP